MRVRVRVRGRGRGRDRVRVRVRVRRSQPGMKPLYSASGPSLVTTLRG